MEEVFFLEKDRIPVFIGKKGENKKLFEEKFGCEIEVDSKSGRVEVKGVGSDVLLTISEIVMAINLGHSPEHALRLEDERQVLDVLDVKDFVRNQSRVKVVVGRVIGREGATRRGVEEMTKASIAVKDSKVSIIAPYESVIIIREALEMLINGAAHKSVYNFLDRHKKEFLQFYM